MATSTGSTTQTYTPTLTITVIQPPDLGGLKAQLDRLVQTNTPANSPDKPALNKASESLAHALKNIRPSPAIKDVLKATEALLTMTDPAVVAIRTGLDTWLQWAAQYAY